MIEAREALEPELPPRLRLYDQLSMQLDRITVLNATRLTVGMDDQKREVALRALAGKANVVTFKPTCVKMPVAGADEAEIRCLTRQDDSVNITAHLFCDGMPCVFEEDEAYIQDMSRRYVLGMNHPMYEIIAPPEGDPLITLEWRYSTYDLDLERFMKAVRAGQEVIRYLGDREASAVTTAVGQLRPNLTDKRHAVQAALLGQDWLARM